MSTWWMDCKNIKKKFFSRWLFEISTLTVLRSEIWCWWMTSPSKLKTGTWSQISKRIMWIISKSHREKNFFLIFLQSIHQVDMKNVVKWAWDFFPTSRIYIPTVNAIIATLILLSRNLTTLDLSEADFTLLNKIDRMNRITSINLSIMRQPLLQRAQRVGNRAQSSKYAN